ncbi:hypothetical protein Tco_1192317 [Tanacetum coccineum]
MVAKNIKKTPQESASEQLATKRAPPRKPTTTTLVKPSKPALAPTKKPSNLLIKMMKLNKNPFLKKKLSLDPAFLPQGRTPVGGVTIRDPISETTTKLPKVVGKSKVVDESDSTIPDPSHQTVTSTPLVIAPVTDFSSHKPSSLVTPPPINTEATNCFAFRDSFIWEADVVSEHFDRDDNAGDDNEETNPVAIVASRAVDPVGSPSSTTIDQDEQSTSTSPTNQEIQSQVTHQGPVPQFMAPDHSSSGPLLHEMMSDHNSSDLAPQRQEMFVENVSSGLVPQGQKASDYDNSDPVPPRQNVVPTAEKTDSSQQGLEKPRQWDLVLTNDEIDK